MKLIFAELGLETKEIDTFLRLLELGAQPVSVIAKQMNIPRSTMYLVLDRLKAVSLVDFFERRGIKYVKPIPAEQIGDVLKQRQKKLEQSLERFSDALPSLQKLENKLSITPKVKFYEGVTEVEKMYKALMKLDGYWAYFNPAALKRVLPKYFVDLPKSYIERGVSAREIMVDGPEAQEYKKMHKSKYYQFKILPAKYAFFSDMLITEDRVFLMSYGEENQICGTEILDPALAQSQRMVHQALWEKI